MTKIEKCRAISGKLKCFLEKNHTGQHSTGYGVSWEETKRIPIKRVNYYIEEGLITKSTGVLVELITEDGRKFWKRDYQFNEVYRKNCRCESDILLERGCQCGSLEK